MMNIYSTKFPQEKIHVHFDKSYYNPGDTIWFKAYIMSGSALSDISRNLYAELTDDAGNVLARRVAPIFSSSAAASFNIPADYSKQLLHFRAYTTWMLNFDTAFLYQKTITIASAPPIKGTAAANPTSLRFFPEGGDLVTGAESLLAFKAVDHYGKPVKVKGSIFNKAGKKIADFATVHYGMGSLLFTPEKGETYSAKWKDAAGKEQTTTIPAAKESGVVMHLIANQDSTLFILKKGSADSGQAKKMLLIAHMNQQIMYEATINFSAANSVVKGGIATSQLGSGILQVTLFDAEQRPLQERIVFVNNNDYLFDAYLNTADKKLTKRGKNILQIEVPDTMSANLSISVTDAAVNVPDENEDNIYSHFLLSSELRGYIHNAGYYFSSYADSVRRQLDLVMLTNGWRRFKWDDLAQGKLPNIKYLPENYISMKGTISGIDASRLPVGTQLNMFVQLKDSTKKFLPGVPVSKNGTFSLQGLIFYDTASIFYQFNNNKDLADRVAIHLDNGLLSGTPAISVPLSPLVYLQDSVVAINKKIAAQYIDMENDKTKKIKLLQGIVVKAKANTKSPLQKLDEQYTSGMFSGGLNNYSLDVGSDISAAAMGNIFNYLQGRIPGLQITNGQSGNPTFTLRGSKPGLFLNEMPVDAQMLSNISMNDIAYVKVINDPVLGGSGGNGAIAVYTKKAGAQPASNEPFKGLSKMKLVGFSPLKEFYSPDYATTDASQITDDLRTTLYWNPFLFIGKDKRKVTVSFYNNDITKRFRVIIEGINEAGKLTRIEELIQ